MKNILTIITLFILFLTACNAQISATPTVQSLTPAVPAPSLTPPPASLPDECGLAAIAVPTLPAKIPAYLQVDADTGLHMTGIPTQVDFATYRLTITGLVDHPLSFTHDQLRCLPKVSASPSLICEGFFVDVATWSGVSLQPLLEMAGIQEGASEIRLKAADGYAIAIPLASALKEENFLAYELNGQTLPVLQGFPLRAVFPSLNGLYWTKWLVGIEVQ
jgi:DMSO/TMAO reductase YedYZ molybdopterin-dependent catalytic subunit